MNVKFREITHVSPAALANFMKFQLLFWLGKFRYEFGETDGQANFGLGRAARGARAYPDTYNLNEQHVYQITRLHKLTRDV